MTLALNESKMGTPADVGHVPRLIRLNHDIWYLIIQNLDSRQDLCNLCLVSKDLYPLVIQHLYRILVIGPRRIRAVDHILQKLLNPDIKQKSRKTRWDDNRALMRRLVEDPNGQQARAVREVEILAFLTKEDDDAAAELEQKDGLAAFVKALPNLQHFRLRSSKPEFENLIRALHDHENCPHIHLLGEDGSRAVTGPMPRVTTIHAMVDPYNESLSDPDQPNRRIPGLQKLFFACPKLKSFSLSVYGNYGGCGFTMPRHSQVYSFELTGDETFPPLESLSLDGYEMTSQEWPHWRDKLKWSDLKSLSLGPQVNTDLLKRFTGHAIALRSLTVKTWAGEGKDTCPELEDFVMSFHTLEKLTVRGHFLSTRALCNHPGLKQLCLHSIELPRDGAGRPTLDVADLIQLDAKCPDLEELDIDIYRDSSGWPNDLTRALASGFTNLRHLTLHSELGIDFNNDSERTGRGSFLLPTFDEDLAKSFAESFFALRPRSRLQTLTLKTGEDLRRFPQWPPAYEELEHMSTLVVRIRAPSSPDSVLAVNIERESEDL